jgi:ribosomal protein S3AE
MNGKDDFYRLLSETGWYTLSTALKGTDIKIIKKVTDNLPHVPSAIIKDILKGRLNPDIVHDEKQIFRARKITVEKILSLYSDCLINLESHDFSV